MKCKKCNGTGEITVPVEEHMGTVLYGTEQCDECDGTGEVMTNEEYLKSCNTEQFAEWISKATIDAWFRQVNNELPKPNGAKEWVEWLKQPHSEVGK